MKVLFRCCKCGKSSWFQVKEDYIVKITDLLCDDCVELLTDGDETKSVLEPTIIFNREG